MRTKFISSRDITFTLVYITFDIICMEKKITHYVAKLYIFYNPNILPEMNKCVFLFADTVLVVVKADIVASLTLLRLCYDISLLYSEFFSFSIVVKSRVWFSLKNYCIGICFVSFPLILSLFPFPYTCGIYIYIYTRMWPIGNINVVY